MNRGYAVAFGTLYAILLTLAALMLLFTVSFGWENRDNSNDDWLKPFAVVMFASAVAVFMGALAGRGWILATGYVVGVLVSIPGLRYALVDWSDHADGKLILFALAVGVSGLLAIVLPLRAVHDPNGMRSRLEKP